MAYQNPHNPDALPWFAEPEKKGAQKPPPQASPPPQQQNFRPPQQPQQQQQQYGQPSQQKHYPQQQQQQQQQQHYQQPPPQQHHHQQYHQPPLQQQNYQRSHSPAVPLHNPYNNNNNNNNNNGGGSRVGLPTGPRPGAGNAPPPRSPVPPQQLRSPPPHHQQQPHSPAAPKLVYQGEEELTTEQLRDIFNGLDTSRIGVIAEKQLAENLVNSDRTKFDPYTVNMMVRMFDSDRSGDLNFSEFVGLWQFLDRWRTIFNRFDTDRSGNINLAEFKNTLVSFQYRLSDSFIEFLFCLYDRENKGTITFDLFMQSCITLKRMTDTFKKYDDDRDGFITINFEDFVSEILRQMKRVMIVDDNKSGPSGRF